MNEKDIVNLDLLNDKQKQREYKATSKDIKSKDLITRKKALDKIKDNRYFIEGNCFFPLLESLVIKKNSLELTVISLEALYNFLTNIDKAVIIKILKDHFNVNKNNYQVFESLINLLTYKDKVKPIKKSKNQSDEPITIENPTVESIRLKSLENLYILIKHGLSDYKSERPVSFNLSTLITFNDTSLEDNRDTIDSTNHIISEENVDSKVIENTQVEKILDESNQSNDSTNTIVWKSISEIPLLVNNLCDLLLKVNTNYQSTEPSIRFKWLQQGIYIFNILLHTIRFSPLVNLPILTKHNIFNYLNQMMKENCFNYYILHIYSQICSFSIYISNYIDIHILTSLVDIIDSSLEKVNQINSPLHSNNKKSNNNKKAIIENEFNEEKLMSGNVNNRNTSLIYICLSILVKVSIYISNNQNVVHNSLLYINQLFITNLINSIGSIYNNTTLWDLTRYSPGDPFDIDFRDLLLLPPLIIGYLSTYKYVDSLNNNNLDSIIEEDKLISPSDSKVDIKINTNIDRSNEINMLAIMSNSNILPVLFNALKSSASMVGDNCLDTLSDKQLLSKTPKQSDNIVDSLEDSNEVISNEITVNYDLTYINISSYEKLIRFRNIIEKTIISLLFSIKNDTSNNTESIRWTNISKYQINEEMIYSNKSDISLDSKVESKLSTKSKPNSTKSKKVDNSVDITMNSHVNLLDNKKELIPLQVLQDIITISTVNNVSNKANNKLDILPSNTIEKDIDLNGRVVRILSFIYLSISDNSIIKSSVNSNFMNNLVNLLNIRLLDLCKNIDSYLSYYLNDHQTFDLISFSPHIFELIYYTLVIIEKSIVNTPEYIDIFVSTSNERLQLLCQMLLYTGPNYKTIEKSEVFIKLYDILACDWKLINFKSESNIDESLSIPHDTISNGKVRLLIIDIFTILIKYNNNSEIKQLDINTSTDTLVSNLPVTAHPSILQVIKTVSDSLLSILLTETSLDLSNHQQILVIMKDGPITLSNDIIESILSFLNQVSLTSGPVGLCALLESLASSWSSKTDNIISTVNYLKYYLNRFIDLKINNDLLSNQSIINDSESIIESNSDVKLDIKIDTKPDNKTDSKSNDLKSPKKKGKVDSSIELKIAKVMDITNDNKTAIEEYLNQSYIWNRPIYFNQLVDSNNPVYLNTPPTDLNTIIYNKTIWPFALLSSSLLGVIVNYRMTKQNLLLAYETIKSFSCLPFLPYYLQPVVTDSFNSCLLSLNGGIIISGLLGRFSTMINKETIYLLNRDVITEGDTDINIDTQLDEILNSNIKHFRYLLMYGYKRTNYWSSEFQVYNANLDKNKKKKSNKKEKPKKNKQLISIIEDYYYNTDPDYDINEIDPNQGNYSNYWQVCLNTIGSDSYAIINHINILHSIICNYNYISSYILVKDLLTIGVNFNIVDKTNGFSPLMYAIVFNNTSIIQLLLSQPDINLNVVDIYGNPLIKYLFLCLENNDIDRIFNGHSSIYDNSDEYIVISNLNINLFQLLNKKNYNIDLNISDTKAGNYPSHFAVGLCSSNITIGGYHLFIQSNIYKDNFISNNLIELFHILSNYQCDINNANYEGVTAIHIASAMGDLALLKYLIFIGGLTNVISECNNYLPIHYFLVTCPSNQSIECFNYLLEQTINKSFIKSKYTNNRMNKLEQDRYIHDIKTVTNNIFDNLIIPVNATNKSYNLYELLQFIPESLNILQLLTAGHIVYSNTSQQIKQYYNYDKDNRLDLLLHFILKIRSISKELLKKLCTYQDSYGFTIYHCLSLLLQGVSKITKQLTDKEKLQKRVRLYSNVESQIIDELFSIFDDNIATASPIGQICNRNIPNRLLPDRWTILHGAISSNNCMFLDYITYKYGNNIINIYSFPYIHYLCTNTDCDYDTSSYMINLYTNSSSIYGSAALNGIDNYYHTRPLHLAVRYKNYLVLKLLLNNIKINPNLKDDISNKTAFFEACESGDYNLIDVFVVNSDRLDFLIEDNEGNTCIEVVISIAKLDILKLLISMRKNDVIERLLCDRGRNRNCLLYELEIENIRLVELLKPKFFQLNSNVVNNSTEYVYVSTHYDKSPVIVNKEDIVPLMHKLNISSDDTTAATGQITSLDSVDIPNRLPSLFIESIQEEMIDRHDDNIIPNDVNNDVKVLSNEEIMNILDLLENNSEILKIVLPIIVELGDIIDQSFHADPCFYQGKLYQEYFI